MSRCGLSMMLLTGVVLFTGAPVAAHSLHAHGTHSLEDSPEVADSGNGGDSVNPVERHSGGPEFSLDLNQNSHAVVEDGLREGYSRMQSSYVMPQLLVLDQQGSTMDLAKELLAPGPVLMNFIFTTCPGICPILSAVTAHAIELLDGDLQQLRIWSVSIDPDHDRPEQLRQYAQAFDAPAQWRFLTGDAAAIKQIRLAYDAASDNKMSHLPMFLIRFHKNDWVRLEGDVTANVLAATVRDALDRVFE